MDNADTLVSNALEEEMPPPSSLRKIVGSLAFGLIGLVAAVGIGFVVITLKGDPGAESEPLSTEPNTGEIAASAVMTGTTVSTESPILAAPPMATTPMAATPATLPSPTPLPSPTALPAPVMVQVTAPQIVPLGLPRSVMWHVAAEEGVMARIVDFGGAMLFATTASGEVAVAQRIAPDLPWQITGLVDPQMGHGEFVIEIRTDAGFHEQIALPWQAADVTEVVTGQIVAAIDGTAERGTTGTQGAAEDGLTHSLSDALSITLDGLPEEWRARPSEHVLSLYFTAAEAPNNQAIVTTFTKEVASTGDPAAVLNYLLDAHNGVGGVTVYGELALDEAQDTAVSGYPARYVRVHTADNRLYGFVGVVSVAETAVVVQGFSPLPESIDQLAEQFGLIRITVAENTTG